MEADILAESTLAMIQDSAKLVWDHNASPSASAKLIAETVLAQATPDHGVFGVYFTREHIARESMVTDGPRSSLEYFTVINFHVPRDSDELEEMIVEVESEHVFRQNGLTIDRYWQGFYIALNHLGVVGL